MKSTDCCGHRIRSLRKSQNMTQEELGSVIGIAGNTIGGYERGRRQPDHHKLLLLAEYFDVPVDYIINNNEFEYKALHNLSASEHYYFQKFCSFNSYDKGMVIDLIREIDKTINNHSHK